MKTNNEILAMLADKTRKQFYKYLEKYGYDPAYWDLNIILELCDVDQVTFKPMNQSTLIDRQQANEDCDQGQNPK